MEVSKTPMRHWIMQVLALMGISIIMLAIAVVVGIAIDGHTRSSSGMSRSTLHHVRISGNLWVRDEFHQGYVCTAFASYNSLTGQSYIHVELWASDTQFMYVDQYTDRPLRTVDGYIMFTASATRNSSLVGQRVPVTILFKENPYNEDQGSISIRDTAGATLDSVFSDDRPGHLYVFAD